MLGKDVLQLIAKDCIPGGSRQNLESANRITEWGTATSEQKALLTDAQTSGGLLLCVAEKRFNDVLQIFRRNALPPPAVVGRIIKSRTARIVIVS